MLSKLDSYRGQLTLLSMVRPLFKNDFHYTKPSLKERWFKIPKDNIFKFKETKFGSDQIVSVLMAVVWPRQHPEREEEADPLLCLCIQCVMTKMILFFPQVNSDRCTGANCTTEKQRGLEVKAGGVGNYLSQTDWRNDCNSWETGAHDGQVLVLSALGL